MRFSYLEKQLVVAILMAVSLGVLSHQIAEGTLSEALELQNKRSTKTAVRLLSHAVYNHHFCGCHPSSFSHCCNCPLEQEVLFLGGPCRSMNAIGCGDFGCGCGIGFPIFTGRCCSETNSPRHEISANKRFDITGFPAAHSPDFKKGPKPSIDSQRYQKATDNYGSYADEHPNIHLKLKPNDGPEPPEKIGGLIHHRPWVPFMHRPLRPLHVWAPRFTPYVLHMVSLPHPTYWDFQGYFPQFMRRKPVSWAMDPFDMRSIRYYPEYHFSDGQFIKFYNPFSSEPQFRDHNSLKSEEEWLGHKDKLHRNLKHSKNKINSHQINSHLHEEDRKMVNHSEDFKEGFKPNKVNQTGPVQKMQENNIGTETNQLVLNLNPSAKEDEEKNYPEYSSEFNTGHFWPSSEKKQGTFSNIVRQFVSSELQKENPAIFRDLKKGHQGFDLDDISTFYARRKELNKGRRKGDSQQQQPTVISSLGAVKVRYDPRLSVV